MDNGSEFRGFHLDIARGAYLMPAVFKEAVQMAAASGFSHFLPYLENMIRLPAMEKACCACAYTLDQWKAFEATAVAAGIELVPHFNVIGHTDQIAAAYPELAGAETHGIDVTLNVTRDWICRCLEQYCEHSDSEFFLIGGDEWQPSDELLARPGFDPGSVWVDHVNLAVEFLAARNRTPIVWHDMLNHFPSVIERLSRKAVIAFWHYNEDSDYPLIASFKGCGFRTIMASGMCNGDVTEARVRAVRCGLAAAAAHQADGFLMTAWEMHRWEILKPAIQIIGDLLRGKAVPPTIIRTFSLHACLQKISGAKRMSGKWKQEISELLRADAWDEYPECRQILKAELAGDQAASLASYEKYHFAEGPLYEMLRTQPHPQLQPSRRENRDCSPLLREGDFGAHQEESPLLGSALHVVNGRESFSIYPKYGGSLQNWKIGEDFIIPHRLPRFLSSRKHPMPGGYRSYTGAGGFRPIWAPGCHQNPSILWQVAYEWNITACDDAIAVDLRHCFQHVDIQYTIEIKRGESGFRFTACGGNKLNCTQAAFNFNLPLEFEENDLDQAQILWKQGNRCCSTTVADERKEFFVVPARDGIVLKRRQWTLEIASDPEQTAGYYFDWMSNMITPDLHGRYRRLSAGESLRTEWRFKVNESAKKQME